MLARRGSVPAASPPGPALRPFSAHARRPHATARRRARCRSRAQPGGQQQQQDLQDPQDPQETAYAYSDPVNQFLGRFLPSSRAARDELRVDFDAPKLRGRSLEEMAALVEAGLTASEWFVTGEVDARLFSDAFAFRDESVATSGIRSYATGVRKLFDQATARAELVSVAPRRGANAIVVVWRLEGRVNLPLKPRIKPYVVTTTLGLDAEGLICSQVDEFSVPGWDLLLSILLGDGFGAKPAPPVETLRAQAAAAAATGAGK